jgi:N-methylhydantoinase A/oxoprolinase/acetone carboxylase beta subunit
MARAAMGWRAAVNLLKLGAGQQRTEFDMAWRVGVDIGGTFTDVALVDDASGAIGVAKVPTTPRNLAEGVLAGLSSAMQRYGLKPPEVVLLSHATTVVTNAILSEHGARAALVTTRGFRDILELRRSARCDLYDPAFSSRAAAASRSASASAPTARSSPRWPRPRSTA